MKNKGNAKQPGVEYFDANKKNYNWLTGQPELSITAGGSKILPVKVKKVWTQ